MAALPGYTAHPQSGEILSLTRALPWWSYKAPKAKLTP
jgi:putative molybdopterin biosynthesis protein